MGDMADWSIEQGMLSECEWCGELCGGHTKDCEWAGTQPEEERKYMSLSIEQTKEFEEASERLIKFLCDHMNPHVSVIVTPTGAELVEGIASLTCDKHVKD